MNISRIALLPLAAAVALAACSGKQADPVPDNETMMAPAEDSATFENIDEPEAPITTEPVETNTARALPPPEVPDEQQIRADAEASGMTARLPAETAGNETQPAE